MPNQFNPNAVFAGFILVCVLLNACDKSARKHDAKITNHDPDPNEFVLYYQQPQAVKKVPPKYPKVAMETKLEATLWVKILIGKDGKPMKAYVEKAHGTKVQLDKFDDKTYEFTEIFTQSALDAATQFRFTPALAHYADTVEAWVTVPFKFRLAQ